MADLDKILSRSSDIEFHDLQLKQIRDKMTELETHKQDRLKEVEHEYGDLIDYQNTQYQMIARSKEMLMCLCSHSIILKYKDINGGDYGYCLSCGLKFNLIDKKLFIAHNDIIDLGITSIELPMVLQNIKNLLWTLKEQQPDLSYNDIKNIIIEDFGNKDLNR